MHAGKSQSPHRHPQTRIHIRARQPGKPQAPKKPKTIKCLRNKAVLRLWEILQRNPDQGVSLTKITKQVMRKARGIGRRTVENLILNLHDKGVLSAVAKKVYCLRQGIVISYEKWREILADFVKNQSGTASGFVA